MHQLLTACKVENSCPVFWRKHVQNLSIHLSAMCQGYSYSYSMLYSFLEVLVCSKNIREMRLWYCILNSFPNSTKFWTQQNCTNEHPGIQLFYVFLQLSLLIYQVSKGVTRANWSLPGTQWIRRGSDWSWPWCSKISSKSFWQLYLWLSVCGP